jgi:hypothetical protein
VECAGLRKRCADVFTSLNAPEVECAHCFGASPNVYQESVRCGASDGTGATRWGWTQQSRSVRCAWGSGGRDEKVGGHHGAPDRQSSSLPDEEHTTLVTESEFSVLRSPQAMTLIEAGLPYPVVIGHAIGHDGGAPGVSRHHQRKVQMVLFGAPSEGRIIVVDQVGRLEHNPVTRAEIAHRHPSLPFLVLLPQARHGQSFDGSVMETSDVSGLDGGALVEDAFQNLRLVGEVVMLQMWRSGVNIGERCWQVVAIEHLDRTPVIETSFVFGHDDLRARDRSAMRAVRKYGISTNDKPSEETQKRERRVWAGDRQAYKWFDQQDL